MRSVKCTGTQPRNKSGNGRLQNDVTYTVSARHLDMLDIRKRDFKMQGNKLNIKMCSETECVETKKLKSR